MFGLKDILRAEDDSLSGSTGIGDDVALLESEEEDAESKESEELPGGDEEEGEETEGEEEETTEEEPPKAEIRPHERPTITDIKKEFPDVLKKWPSLRDIIYREKRYDEEFGNVDEAVKAKGNSESFEALHEDIFKGDGTNFFNSIKDEDPQALQRFATKILPTLMKVDEKAHWAAANPLIQLMLVSFKNSAKEDEDVQKSANLFAKFIFANHADDVLNGKIDFTPKEEEKPKVDPEVAEYRKEKFNSFVTDVHNECDKGLENLILSKNKQGKLFLDPDGEFTEWLTKALIKTIKTKVDEQIKADQSHQKYASQLWKKAEKAKYSSDAKSSIISAFLERARPLVLAIRPKEVAEMRGKSIGPKKAKKAIENSRRIEAGGGGGISRNGGGKTKADYRKMSDEEIINED